jgi:hypothetical protein
MISGFLNNINYIIEVEFMDCLMALRLLHHGTSVIIPNCSVFATGFIIESSWVIT